MPRMTYERALDLLREGRLREVIEISKMPTVAKDLRTRVLGGYALALAGDTKGAATSIAGLDSSRLPPLVRSTLEATSAMVSWRIGDLDGAWKHFNVAMQTALESGDSERIAWFGQGSIGSIKPLDPSASTNKRIIFIPACF